MRRAHDGILCLAFLAACGGGDPASPADAAGRTVDSAPPPADAGLLRPSADVTIGGGSHHYASIDVPAGVTVTVSGAATLEVDGEVKIAGTLRADCHALVVLGGGALTID